MILECNTYFNNVRKKLKFKGALDVKICPNNADLISYILNDNVYVQDLVSKREFKLTSSVDPVKSGVPSYAVQEEFNRYTGYWWQPQQSSSTTYRIVYEEVDDGCVDLIYISPSCESEFGVDTYRYPKAGTKNSRTELRMAEFTFSSDPSGVSFVLCFIMPIHTATNSLSNSQLIKETDDQL